MTTLQVIKSTYSAKAPSSSIKMSADLPLEVHQMIVWIMHHQTSAVYLLPKYKELREIEVAYSESQKTHAGQDI